jgi:CheY-like chemotaxis protein
VMKTILIVDDEHDIATAIEMVLTFEGYQTFHAQNGQEALDLLKTMATPALIISDLMMPVLNGYEFVRELRTNPVHHSIPVIITSAGQLDEKRLPLQTNLWFLRKPFDLDKLITLVEQLVPKS